MQSQETFFWLDSPKIYMAFLHLEAGVDHQQKKKTKAGALVFNQPDCHIAPGDGSYAATGEFRSHPSLHDVEDIVVLE